MDATQAISIAGAVLVLGAFAALQFKRLGPQDPVYLVMNVVGSACLALAAGLGGLWAFVVLNSVWGLVSLHSLVFGRRRAPVSRGEALLDSKNDPG